MTELTARPLLRLFDPEFGAVRQPLAGQIAARRDLDERLPFVTGYGVDIGLLLDVHAAVGLAGMAQVDLGVRQNAHQPLKEPGPMADAVRGAVASRLVREGRLVDGPEAAELGAASPAHRSPDRPSASVPIERPPVWRLRAAACHR